VDGDTCDGYYTEEDTGKIKVITNDGTLQTIEQSVSPLAAGEGNQSIQHKDTSAKAYGDRSVAFNNAIAGTKGYRYKAIDLHSDGTGIRIWLTKSDITDGSTIKVNLASAAASATWTDVVEELSLGYTVNDIITLKTSSTDFDRCGKILKIEKNCIWVPTNAADTTSGIKLSDLTVAKVQAADNKADRYSVSVLEKPNLGTVVVSDACFAIGGRTGDNPLVIAGGTASFAGGRKSKTTGDVAFAFGASVIAGYQSFAAGDQSEALNRNTAIGYKCKNYGNQAFATGNSNTIYATGGKSFVAGESNKIDHELCAVFGYGNYTTAPY
jgi:hypothetical protein